MQKTNHNHKVKCPILPQFLKDLITNQKINEILFVYINPYLTAVDDTLLCSFQDSLPKMCHTRSSSTTVTTSSTGDVEWKFGIPKDHHISLANYKIDICSFQFKLLSFFDFSMYYSLF